MKIAGIIGPYYCGGDPRLIEHSIANAKEVIRVLANSFGPSKAVGFFCPHTHTSRFEVKANAPEDYYYRLDDEIFDRACDFFIALPTWTESKGAVRDYKRALERGKPVLDLRDFSMEGLNRLITDVCLLIDHLEGP